MKFHIYGDDGASIRGWIVSDNPVESSVIQIVVPGREIVELVCGDFFEPILDLGWHANGKCGFVIDGSVLPGIEDEREIVVLELKTKFNIYRRFRPGRNLKKKIMLFDASLLPQRRFYKRFADFFSVQYNFTESIPFETLIHVVQNEFPSSKILTGRPSFHRHGANMKLWDFTILALLRAPFEELAERLIVLNSLAKSDSAGPVKLLAHGVAPLLDFARGFPFDDARAMAGAFRRASSEQRELLRDPFTRLFGCDLNESPGRDTVTRALHNLATIDVVGVRDNFGAFKRMASDIVGEDIFGAQELTTPSNVADLARRLSRVRGVRGLLENDLILYSYFEEAVRVGLRA